MFPHGDSNSLYNRKFRNEDFNKFCNIENDGDEKVKEVELDQCVNEFGDQPTFENYNQRNDSALNVIKNEPVYTEMLAAYAPVEKREEVEEGPLLEELEINLDLIILKCLIILSSIWTGSLKNQSHIFTEEVDVCGPIMICLSLATCLFLSGSSTHFGYIYGLSMISIIAMYVLLNLLSNKSNFEFKTVASILGYCLLPMVGLAFLKIFTTFHGYPGVIGVLMVVLWCSFIAANLFEFINNDSPQKLIIFYPCFLMYAMYALIVTY